MGKRLWKSYKWEYWKNINIYFKGIPNQLNGEDIKTKAKDLGESLYINLEDFRYSNLYSKKIDIEIDNSSKYNFFDENIEIAKIYNMKYNYKYKKI